MKTLTTKTKTWAPKAWNTAAPAFLRQVHPTLTKSPRPPLLLLHLQPVPALLDYLRHSSLHCQSDQEKPCPRLHLAAAIAPSPFRPHCRAGCKPPALPSITLSLLEAGKPCTSSSCVRKGSNCRVQSNQGRRCQSCRNVSTAPVCSNLARCSRYSRPSAPSLRRQETPSVTPSSRSWCPWASSSDTSSSMSQIPVAARVRFDGMASSRRRGLLGVFSTGGCHPGIASLLGNRSFSGRSIMSVGLSGRKRGAQLDKGSYGPRGG